MRTRFSASLIAAAAVAVLPGLSPAEGIASTPVDFDGGTITYEVHGARTALSISTSDGRKYEISLPRDSNVGKGVAPSEVRLVGQLDDSALILTDAYPSVAGGLDYCEAGQEKFLRVISLLRKRATQTYHTKLESCRQNITLSDPGVEWNKDEQTLTIHWASSRKGLNKPDSRTLKVGPRDVALKQ